MWLMSKLLFSVSPTDPLTFAAIVVLLLADCAAGVLGSGAAGDAGFDPS